MCHGSPILSADFVGQLNHAHKSRPSLSFVWHPLYSSQGLVTDKHIWFFFQQNASKNNRMPCPTFIFDTGSTVKSHCGDYNSRWNFIVGWLGGTLSSFHTHRHIWHLNLKDSVPRLDLLLLQSSNLTTLFTTRSTAYLFPLCLEHLCVFRLHGAVRNAVL